MSYTVELLGGPCDGEFIAIDAERVRPFIKFHSMPDISFGDWDQPNSTPLTPNEIEYAIAGRRAILSSYGVETVLVYRFRGGS